MFACIPSSWKCYLWLQIGCDYTFANETCSKECKSFFLICFLCCNANDDLSEMIVVQAVFGMTTTITTTTCSQLCSCSPEHPHTPIPAPPPALGPRKRFIVQAESESTEAWFWLARCAASETLTFLQGLHLELVSCSACAEQGRSLAQLCNWARLRLYGPRDG